MHLSVIESETNMTLENIYYIGQTVAVVALLLSIIFVGLQIRQNTKALKSTSHHAITDSFNQLNVLIGTDPKAGRIWRLGLGGPENLDVDEQMSFSFLCLGYMRIFETLYFQNKNGTMDAQLFESKRRSIVAGFPFPGWRAWWATNTLSFSDEFRTFIDEAMQSTLADAVPVPEPEEEPEQ